MSKFYLDSFDSKMLKARVGKLEAGARLTAVALRRYVERHNPAMVCAVVPFCRPVIRVLERWGATLVSIRETYACQLKAARLPRNRIVGFSVIRHKPGGLSISAGDIASLAETFSSVGRFGQDERIPRRTVKKIYETWVANSLYNGYANAAWYVERAGRLAALLTVKHKGGGVVIDLLAVRPEFQGRGLGRALMAEAQAYVRQQKLGALRVGVEGENVAARAFYQKCGFIVQTVNLIYHWHRKKLQPYES